WETWRPVRLERAGPGAGGGAGQHARGKFGRQHQRRIAAHAETHHMRLVDPGRIEHGDRITIEDILAVELFLLRAIRWRIAPRAPGERPPAAPEVAHLIIPAAAIAGELVDEEDGRAATGLLVVDPRTLGGGVGHGGQASKTVAGAPGAGLEPVPRRPHQCGEDAAYDGTKPRQALSRHARA